jgi:hypothetical protein
MTIQTPTSSFNSQGQPAQARFEIEHVVPLSEATFYLSVRV